jgi:hypothetical protein
VVHSLVEERVGPRFVLTGSSARKLRQVGDFARFLEVISFY